MTANELGGRRRVVAEPTLLVGVDDCRLLRWALTAARDLRIRKEAKVSDGLDELLEAVTAVAEVGDRAAWVARRRPNTSVAQIEDEPILDAIGTAEAAELLGCSERQARRLANAGDLGPVTNSSGRKQISRGAVIEHARQRAAASW